MKTNTKSLLINKIDKISGIMGVQDIIKSFAFYDINSVSFAKYLHFQKNKLINDDINNAASRKNGYRTPLYEEIGRPSFDDDNTVGHHWIFKIYRSIYNSNDYRVEVQLQGLNCTKCGEYMYLTNGNEYPNRYPLCCCQYHNDRIQDYDYETDDYEEYDSQ